MIHPALEAGLQDIELCAEERRLRSGGFPNSDKYVHVALRIGLVPGEGAVEGEAGHVEPFSQDLLVLSQGSENIVSVHVVLLTTCPSTRLEDNAHALQRRTFASEARNHVWEQ